MPDHQHLESPSAEPLESPISVSHFFRVLGSYRPIIGLSLAAITIGYIIIALAVYIFAPAQRVTTMTFRLEFEGAERGEYPNGTKFSSAEIISMPVLLKVYNQNNLSRFTPFNKFARSVFVLESNAAQEALSRYFQSRLADPRLTPADRERIQQEYETKIAALSKSEYGLNYLHSGSNDPIPDVLVRKVLHDVLREWADFVSHEQHVLEYRVPVLSPDMVAPSRIETNPVIAAEVLRAKILRVMANIDLLRMLPAAELVRSKPEGLSLNDIRIRLDDLVRFRLEPLVQGIAANQLDDRASTIRFFETQVAYDQRLLDAQVQMTDAARDAMAMYTGQLSDKAATTASGSTTAPRPVERAESESVTPQLGDTFLDRLMQLTSSSVDYEYRQRLSDRYREAAVAVAPLQQAVEYDRSALALIRSASGGGGGITREVVNEQIEATRQEVRELVLEIRQIYLALSTNLNPSTELITTTGAPTTRLDRIVGVTRLALFGLLTLFVALPLIIIACLIHNRVREEEAAQSAQSHLNAAG